MRPDGIEVVYKMVDELDLKLRLFLPTQRSAISRRPALILFHGGGFVGGHPVQFFPYCQHFAARGLVAISAHYRLLGKGADSIGDCLADAKSAIRWLRIHADELQIDVAKVIAGGASSGANLAANAAMVEGWDALDDDTSVNAKPDALVLLTPALFEPAFFPGRFDPQFYTVNHIQPHLPPMLIVAGADDTHFPLPEMERFRDAVMAHGNRCELCVFPGDHGFFNYTKDNPQPYEATVNAIDGFLSTLSILHR